MPGASPKVLTLGRMGAASAMQPAPSVGELWSLASLPAPGYGSPGSSALPGLAGTLGALRRAQGARAATAALQVLGRDPADPCLLPSKRGEGGCCPRSWGPPGTDPASCRCPPATPGVQALGSPVCSVNPAVVETNVVLLCVGEGWPSPAELCARLEAVSTEEEAETGRAVSLRLLPWSARCLRAVWHRDVSAEDTELAMDKLRFVAEKCRQEREAVS